MSEVHPEHTPYILIRLTCNRSLVNSIAGGKGAHDLYDEGTLVALSTVWDRSHIRAVGLENDTVQGDCRRKILTKMTALERLHAPDDKDETVET